MRRQGKRIWYREVNVEKTWNGKNGGNLMKRILLLVLCIVAYASTALAAPTTRDPWMADIEGIAQHPEKIYEVYRGMPLSDFNATWQNVPGWKLGKKDSKSNGIAFEKTENGITQRFEVFPNARDNVVSSMSLTFDCPDEKTTKRIYNFARNAFSLHYKNAGDQDFCYQQKPLTYPYKWFWTDDKTTTTVLTLSVEHHVLSISSGAWNPNGKY